MGSQSHAAAIRNAVGNERDLRQAVSALSSLSDTQVVRVAKALWGRPSKSRADAMQNIQNFINRERLSIASHRALDGSPL